MTKNNMSFLKLSPCSEDGTEHEGFIFVAANAFQVIRRTEHCTELFLMGGGHRFVTEKPEEIIAKCG